MSRNRRPDFLPGELPPGAKMLMTKLEVRCLTCKRIAKGEKLTILKDGMRLCPECGRIFKQSKYRNVRTEYAGITYDSKAEAERAEYLDSLIASKTLIEVIRQPRFHLGCPENVYVADFLCVPHGPMIAWVEDVKGADTPKFKRDMKLWRSYGRLELNIIRKSGKVEIIQPERKET